MSEPTPATPPPTEPPDRGPPPSSSSHHPEQLRRSQCSGMDVEETLPPQYPPAKASFRDVVSGTARCFPTATALTEQLREDTEALLPGPDTPHNVSFSPHQLQILQAPWSQTLMGKVLGASVRYEILKLRIPLLWKTQGKLDIIDLGKAIFLFKFELKSDLERIMLGGPWFLFGHYLMLTRWQPNFRPSANPFSSMLVWVRFPELPVEYFHKQALFEIAKLVGLPIKVDLATDSVSRARYARVCIEISLLKPLVSKIWVENAWQQIKYENLDLLCFSCGIVGHLAAHCNQGVDGQQFELPSASPSLPPPDNQSLDKLSPRSAPVTTGAMPNPTVSPGPSTQKSFKHSEEWVVVRARKKSPPQSSKAGHWATVALLPAWVWDPKCLRTLVNQPPKFLPMGRRRYPMRWPRCRLMLPPPCGGRYLHGNLFKARIFSRFCGIRWILCSPLPLSLIIFKSRPFRLTNAWHPLIFHMCWPNPNPRIWSTILRDGFLLTFPPPRPPFRSHLHLLPLLAGRSPFQPTPVSPQLMKNLPPRLRSKMELPTTSPPNPLVSSSQDLPHPSVNTQTSLLSISVIPPPLTIPYILGQRHGLPWKWPQSALPSVCMSP